MNTLRPQVKKNVSSLRKGLGWFATLVGVALLIVLVGCPEDDSSSSSSPVTVALTDGIADNFSLTIRASAVEDLEDTVWAVVFPVGTALAGTGDEQITNVQVGGPTAGVDNNGTASGTVAIFTDEFSANADRTEDLAFMDTVEISGSSSFTLGTEYAIYVAIGNDDGARLIGGRLVVTATDGTAPTATIVAESVNSATSGVGSITATFTGLSEPATAYWIVVDDGACPTDVASVKDVPASGEIAIAFTAANGGGPVRGSTEIDNDADTDVSNVIMITGAAPGISGGTHDLCIVLEDAAGNAGDVLTQILTP
jgi:hypothetical protein